MSKRLIAVLVATCAILGSGLSSARAQTDEGVKSRLADLESKVDALLRENSELRSKVGELESEREDARTREDLVLSSELEKSINALSYIQDGSIVQPPNGVDQIYFTGEWRTRFDYRSNTGDLTDSIDDEGLRLDYRFNLGIGFYLTPVPVEEGRALVIETYFEIQSAGRAANNTGEDLASSIGAGAGGFEARGNELDDIQLRQAWIQMTHVFGVEDLTFKFGRQSLALGSGLMLGENDFFTGTVHDGAVFHIPLGEDSRLVAFYTKQGAPDGLVSPGLATGGLLTGRFRASGDEDEMLGLYAELRPESLSPVKIDLYWIYFDAHGPQTGVTPVNGTTSADPGIDSFGRAKIGGDFHTLGFLVQANDLFVDGLYMSTEFAYQLGDDELGEDIDAMILEVRAEYALPFMSESNGRVFAAYYFAEGPDSSTGQGFTPLFISRHEVNARQGTGFSRLGNIDFIPTQNVHVLQIGFKFEPAEKWTAGFTYLNSFLNHGNRAVTTVQTGDVFVDDRHLGHELDFFALYRHSDQTEFFFNVSIFIPEFDYIFEDPQNAGPGPGGVAYRDVDADLAFGAYAQVRVTF